jgi:hypothetical protein
MKYILNISVYLKISLNRFTCVSNVNLDGISNSDVNVFKLVIYYYLSAFSVSL